MTFDDARSIVDGALQRAWAGPGTFYVAPWGWEDDNAYQVMAGAEEFLKDGRAEFAEYDQPVVLVRKRDGRIDRIPYLPNAERLDAMTPVGTGHPE